MFLRAVRNHVSTKSNNKLPFNFKLERKKEENGEGKQERRQEWFYEI